MQASGEPTCSLGLVYFFFSFHWPGHSAALSYWPIPQHIGNVLPHQIVLVVYNWTYGAFFVTKDKRPQKHQIPKNIRATVGPNGLSQVADPWRILRRITFAPGSGAFRRHLEKMAPRAEIRKTVFLMTNPRIVADSHGQNN